MFCFIFLLDHNKFGTEPMAELCIFRNEHELFSVRCELNLRILVDELEDP